MDSLKAELASGRIVVNAASSTGCQVYAQHNEPSFVGLLAAGDQTSDSITDCCSTCLCFRISTRELAFVCPINIECGSPCIVSSTVQHSTCFGERILRGFHPSKHVQNFVRLYMFHCITEIEPMGEVARPYSVLQHFHMSTKRLSTRACKVTALYVPFKVMGIGSALWVLHLFGVSNKNFGRRCYRYNRFLSRSVLSYCQPYVYA